MFHIVLLLAVLCQPFISLQAEEKPSLVSRVQKLAAQAYPYEEEEWDNDTIYCDFLLQVLQNQLIPAKMRKHNITYKLINTDPIFTESIVHEATTWQDLNFFAGKNQSDPCMGSKLDQTVTGLGKAQLYTMLGASVSNQDTIEQQQARIQLFLNNTELREQVQQILAKFAQAENVLLSFWSRDPFMSRIKEHYDFKDMLFKKFNHNQELLALKHTYDTSNNFLNFFTEMLGCGVLSVYSFSQLFPDRNATNPKLRISATENKSRNIVVQYLWEKDLRPLNIAIATSGAYYLYHAMLENIDWICDMALYDEILHFKLQHVNKAWSCFEELNTMITPELCTLMPELTAIKNLVTPNESHESPEDSFASLTSLIKSDTFAPDSTSMLAHRGKMLLAYKLMHSKKNTFIGALHAISTLDCYSSLASLMHNEKDTYCFAQFEQANTPHLYLENFINPLVASDSDKIVSNSLELGGNAASRNCVITGPNAGGKSTLVKAVGINVLMAQSLGIAAAQKCILTPFSFVATYLNITDDIHAGNSLFRAEVLRTQELINSFNALGKGQHGLLIFDEIFNGTTPTEGSAAAYAVAKHLGTFTNCITVLATHFEQLTKLEAQPQCSYKNYKVSVTINRDGSLTYPFKLEEGTSKQHIAIDVLRSEGYDVGILREAEELLRA